MPRIFLLRCRAVRPSSTPPAMPIAPVTAGIATLVTALFSELPADSAVSATFDVASLAVDLARLPADLALLPVDRARERVAPPAALAPLRAERLPDDLEPLPDRELPPLPELPPEAARERLVPLEPLEAAALGLLPLPLLLPEDLRLDVRPRVAARVLLDPEDPDPLDDVPEDDFAREDARPDEPREVLAAISLNLLLGSARRSDLGGFGAGARPRLPGVEPPLA
jgi:hypothetical protein